MDIGLAFDLKSDFAGASGPDDRLEEYDSAETVESIARALTANGYTPRQLGGGRRFLQEVLAAPPALVFNIAEGFGTRSREAHVPAVLEMLGVPCTHSDPLTCAASLDKAVAKSIVAAAGVPTPRCQVIAELADLRHLQVTLPVIAKPLFEGSSMGIRKNSRADDAASLHQAVARLLHDYEEPVLVEEFCPGPEFTIGILGTGAAAEPIGVMEILPKRAATAEFIYSLEVKRNYLEEVEYQVPPRRPRQLLQQMQEIAVDAYRALGCRDVGRVDLRLDAEGTPLFLELNPLPGLHPVTGDIVILAERSHLPYEQLIGRIVDRARARYGL